LRLSLLTPFVLLELEEVSAVPIGSMSRSA
jgi:hypothetical protein